MEHSAVPTVAVHIATFNHCSTIEAVLRSVLAQSGFTPGRSLHIFVTDNASTDGTPELVRKTFGDTVMLDCRPENLGFTGAHNNGPTLLDRCTAEYLFILNPDVRLEPGCLKELCRVLARDRRAGTACPKLLRADAQLQPAEPARLDSSGMYMTPEIRHFDRGSEELDTGQYERHEYVFGSSGAALLIRRNTLLDAAVREEGRSPELRLFDDAFFAYREDADLAWRLQWLGWKCRYVPTAVGYHIRNVLPERRSLLPAELNAYSVRNRFLLQLNNFSLAANWQNLLPLCFRNLLVIGAVLTVERTSAGALMEALRAAPRALRRRAVLLRRARSSAAAMQRWFSAKPEAQPALELSPAKQRIGSIQVIVVNYNSGARLGACLRSISRTASELRSRSGCGIEMHASVIDNDSSDGSAERVRPMFEPLEGFEFLMQKRNLGFAGGIQAAARDSTADAILIMNPDVELSAEAAACLAEDLGAHSDIGLLAPVLIGADGAPQAEFAVRSFPSLGSTFAELFYLHRLWPNNPWTVQYRLGRDHSVNEYLREASNNGEFPQEALDLPLVVPQPAAACVLVRRRAYEQIGGFDESFWPAWFEDVDFSKRLAAAGWLSAVTSRARVRHEGGYSARELPSCRFMEIWYRNLRRYWEKHGSRTERLLLAAALPAGLLLRSVVHLLSAGAGSLLGRKDCQAHLAASGALLRLAAAKSRPDAH